MSEENNEHEHTKRDGETQIMLGIFMCALALPVMVGTIFSDTVFHGVVCFISGVVLLGIGGGFCYKGLHTLRKLP